MPVSRNEALAHVTASGRGAAIWRELRGSVSEKDKIALEDELNGLATAYMLERVEIGKSSMDLTEQALRAGVRPSVVAMSLWKQIAEQRRQPGETIEAATVRLFGEEPAIYELQKTLEAVDRNPAAARRQVRIEKMHTQGSPAHTELETKAKELRKSDPLLSFAQAVDAVLATNLELADRVFDAERGD